IQEAFHVNHVSVLLREEDDLILRAHHGTLTPRILEGGRLPSSAGLWGRALAAGKTVIEHDVRVISEYVGVFDDTASRICINLLSFVQTLGALVLDSAATCAYHVGDTQSLE